VALKFNIIRGDLVVKKTKTHHNITQACHNTNTQHKPLPMCGKGRRNLSPMSHTRSAALCYDNCKLEYHMLLIKVYNDMTEMNKTD